MKLETSEKFKKEFEDYRERIEKISKESLKLELTGLLKEMLSKVRSIDVQHNQLFERKSLPTSVVDTRSNLLEIRRKIDKKLKDWERAES